MSWLANHLKRWMSWLHDWHPRRPRGSQSGGGRNSATKVFKNGRKNPWVPSLTGPFPNGFANTGSWLGRKNPLYYSAQSASRNFRITFLCSYSQSRLEMVRWDLVPRGSSALEKLSSRHFARPRRNFRRAISPVPDWLPLGLRGCMTDRWG